MGLATWPAATLIKKICFIDRHLTNQGRGGGVFKKNIIYICIVVSSDKEGKWSFFIALVHARLGSARPCMRYFYDICNTMTESSTRRLKLLTLNFYNMSNRKNYAAPEMQSFEVNAEAGFAVSPGGYEDGQFGR